MLLTISRDATEGNNLSHNIHSASQWSPDRQQDKKTILQFSTILRSLLKALGPKANGHAFACSALQDRIDQAGNERRERRFQVEYDDNINGDMDVETLELTKG